MAAAVDSWSSQTIGDISTLKPFFEGEKGFKTSKKESVTNKGISEDLVT